MTAKVVGELIQNLELVQKVVAYVKILIFLMVFSSVIHGAGASKWEVIAGASKLICHSSEPIEIIRI